MLNTIFTRSGIIARLEQNPLGAYLEELATGLHEQGYAPSSIQVYLRAAAKFGDWLQQQNHSITKIDEAILNCYVSGLARHRSGNRCKAGAGLHHLFQLLRQHGVVEPLAKSTIPGDQWLASYDRYLEQVVGAAISTRERYRCIVRRFIFSYCGTHEPDWSSLSAQAISDFVRHEAACRHGYGRKAPSVAIRSFLRFLVFQGEIRAGLEAAAPAPPQWTHMALPVRLTPEEVERVVSVYRDGADRNLRNYAMLLLLARLGLRAGEVIALRLEDIDWFEGRLFIRPGKTHQERCLPLMHEVGSALAAYLKDGRPQSTSRRVFLRDRVPFTPLASNCIVGWIVNQALHRAGVAKRPRLGSHLFRHTAASGMLNQGASFKDVADVLGHRCLQTTGLYAKLELEALTDVALPWLGGEQ